MGVKLISVETSLHRKFLLAGFYNYLALKGTFKCDTFLVHFFLLDANVLNSAAKLFFCHVGFHAEIK